MQSIEQKAIQIQKKLLYISTHGISKKQVAENIGINYSSMIGYLKTTRLHCQLDDLASKIQKYYPTQEES